MFNSSSTRRATEKSIEVKRMKELQKQCTTDKKDHYMVGMFNGLELATSILEDRQPEFMDMEREPPIIEHEEPEAGRTIVTGIRRRGNKQED